MDEEIARLLAGGLSARAVARQTGASRAHVTRVREERDIAVYAPPVPEHGTDARYQRECRCDACCEAHARVNAAEHARARRPQRRQAFPADTSERNAKLHAADQQRTRETATSHYRAWTEADLAVALDYAYSATDAATILGRTRASVLHARVRYGGDGKASAPLPRGRRATRE